MKKTIQILEYIRTNGPKTVAQIREAGLITEGRSAEWYHLRQRGFLKTLHTDTVSGLLVCDITSKGKENIIKTKRKETFVPIPIKSGSKKLDDQTEVTITITNKTKFTKNTIKYDVYVPPKWGR